MRAAIVAGPAAVLLLLVIPAALAATTTDRGTWTQFYPDWERGPARVAFGDATLDVPEGVAAATDGSTWFYATTEDPERLREPPECEFGKNASSSGTLVILGTDCWWAQHPMVLCKGTDLCQQAMASTASTTAPATPASPPTPTPGTFPTSPMVPVTWPDDTCAALRHARCTPGLPLGAWAVALGVVALLSAPWRGRGPS